MGLRRLESSEFGSRHFRDHARKLLAAPAPSPVVDNSSVSPDVKTGGEVSFQNPHPLIMIASAMGCLLFVVTIALLLLCWSYVRQRRIEREHRNANRNQPADQRNALSAAAAAAPPPVDSPVFDDAVLVQLPGDDRPQFFALPTPFLADGARHQQDDLNEPTEVAIKAQVKDPSSGPVKDPSSGYADSEHDPANPVVEDACVPSSDDHLHNPLFPPR